MELTPSQRAALENLAQKKAGQDVGFITIADARALTEMGLAERNSSGWRITSAGETFLNDVGSPTPHLGVTLHRLS